MASLIETQLFPMGYRAEFGRCQPNGGISKNWTSGVPPLKIIQVIETVVFRSG